MPDEVIEQAAATEAQPSAPATETQTEPVAQATEPAAQEQQPTEPKAAAEQKPAAATAEAEKADVPAADNTAEQLAALQGENYALKHGVSADNAADVVTLARAQVTDKVTLEQAIENVIAKYPHFKGELPAITTPSTKNDPVTETNDAFINSIMGIK